jgi:hypothetical protein
MSYQTRLELRFGVDAAPDLETVRDDVESILRDVRVSLEVYDDLADAFVDGEAIVNIGGGLLAEIVKRVAALLPESPIEARIAGEEFRDTVIFLVQGSSLLFEQGPWPYDV